jgi:HSP20 family protein
MDRTDEHGFSACYARGRLALPATDAREREISSHVRRRRAGRFIAIGLAAKKLTRKPSVTWCLSAIRHRGCINDSLDQSTRAFVLRLQDGGAQSFKIKSSITMRLVRYTYPSYRNFAPVLGGVAHSPWSGFDRAVDSFLADLAPNGPRTVPVNVHEDKDNLYVSAELPGVARDDVNLELTDDVLSLRATRKVPGAQTEAGAPEVQKVEFSRSFDLPYAVQADKVSAELKDGVLRLTLPKAEALKPRKIAVN